MLPRIRVSFAFAIAIGCTLLVCGCKTSRPVSRPLTGHRKADRVQPEDPELQRLAEAHAHYAEGVLQEISEQPEAALKEYKEAALLDPGNETLVLEVSRRFL